MPVQRLEPTSSINDGFGGISVIGAATAHEALSDASDASYVVLQLIEAEPLKWWRGAMSDLPDGAGVAVGTIINVRADNDDTLVPTPSVKLRSGEYPTIPARLTDTLTGAPVDYATAPLDLGTVAAINGSQYMAGAEWIAHTCFVRIYKMNFDVDFNFVNGVTAAMIFQWLGPLVAVGLNEMPRLSLELWRRSRTFLRPHELEGAWREMVEHRASRHFILARAVSR